MPTAILSTLAVFAVNVAIDEMTPSEPLGVASTETATAPAKAVEPNSARSVAVRQAVPPRQFAYGECRIGGAVFFEDADNPYLYIGTALSDGPIDAITGVYFGNQQITLAAESPSGQAAALAGTIYAGNFNMSYRLGTSTQTADPLLAGFVPAVPANFWQRGVACGVVRLHWGQDSATHQVLWGQSLSPSFSGRFRKVYDPRNGTHNINDPTTWTYSANPALCVADALTRAWFVGLGTTYVDWASVAAAANACDVTTTYNATSVPLFTIAGVFRSENNMASQIDEMLASFRGCITFSDGKYKISADAPRTAVWDITDDDILEFVDHVHGASYAAAYNAIKATYFDASDSGRQGTTPVYEDATAVAAEGVRETAIDLPFCPAEHSAQILAYRKLKEIRNGRRLTLRVSDAAMALDAFELVTVSSASLPFINGTWQIDQIDMTDDGYILAMREYIPALYADPTTYLV